MKSLLRLIVFFCFGVSAVAQTIYWTGNEDRWGGGSNTPTKDDNFSLAPGGTEYQKLSDSESYDHVYDRSASGQMAGSIFGVSMNRSNNTILSMTLIGDGTEGFSFNTVAGKNCSLAGSITASGGLHQFANDGAETVTLTANTVWEVAADSGLVWSINLAESTVGTTLTKTGDGILIIDGGASLSFTGAVSINAGSFGGLANLAGALTFAAGSKLEFASGDTLFVAGGVSFAGPFGIADINGLSSAISAGSYTLIDGAVDFANISNVGAANAVSIGDGAIAYFQEGVSSLVLVLEGSTGPNTWAGFDIVTNPDGVKWVDTGAEFLYVLDVTQADTGWLYSWRLRKWIYLPESWVEEGRGTWLWVGR